MSNSEVITTGQTANWQRYKLTEADGKSIFTNLNNDLEKLRNLTPGYFIVQIFRFLELHQQPGL